MPDRFYADSDFDRPAVELGRAESHHLAHVMRGSVGDRVTLFNGRGKEATGEIERVSKHAVHLRVVDVCDIPRLLPRITLAVAVPKGERFRWLVEKAAELGVERLIPLVTSRSIVNPGAGKLEKLRQTAVAAAKQCGSAWLLEIDEPVDFPAFLSSLDGGADVQIAHPGGRLPDVSSRETHARQPLILIIGPEGGFSDEEVAEAVRCGAQPVRLGTHVLRVETAAVAIAAYWRLARLSEPA